MDKGLEGRRPGEAPRQLAATLAALRSRGRSSVPLIRFAARLGSRDALEEAVARAGDPSEPDADRLALVELIGQVDRRNGFPALIGLAPDERNPAMQAAALGALGGYDQPEVATSLLRGYPSLKPSARDRVVSLLCSRPGWAASLVDAMETRTVPSRDVRPGQVLQILQLKDSGLKAKIEAVWGRVPGPGSPEKLRRISEVRGFLPEGDKGDARRGRAVFKEVCSVCHKLFDEGESIGPDLSGAERSNLDFLLSSLVDPSALVRKEYQAQTVALDDGRVLNGLVAEETGTTVTLIDANRQKTVVPRDRIEAMKVSDVSLMPEGLLDRLSETQVRDLFKYLQASGPAR